MRIAVIALLVLSLVSFAPGTQADVNRVDSLLNSMTLPEKVGQLFMTNIYGHRPGIDGISFIQDYHPGSVAVFGYNTNGSSPETFAAFANALQEAATTSGAQIPLIIATDQEGGTVQRLTQGVTPLPDPLGFGATIQDAALIRVAQRIGEELAAVGITMNLAPVADLTTREDMLNTYRVMHRRTFGDDPERVGIQVAAFTQGLAQGGVIGVLKHFPGHGGAADSHVDIPRVTLNRETAFATALHVFEVAIQHGAPAIMVGHLYYSDIEPVPNLPASLSPTMMNILRDDFGFDGVIMSDAMNMAAILDYYAPEDAILQFIRAGGDMIVAGPYLSLQDQRDAIHAILDAVEEGSLPESRIDESVRRILQLKADYGLLDWTPIDTEGVESRIDLAASQQILIDTFMDAATVVRDDENLLPLRPDEQHIAVIYPAWYTDILDTCMSFAPDATYHGYMPHVAQWELGVIKQIGEEHDVIIMFTEDAFSNARQQEVARLLPPEKTIVVALSSPYDLEKLPPISTYLAMYNSLPASHIAACTVLFGEHTISGRLPLAIEGYASGSGLTIAQEN